MDARIRLAVRFHEASTSGRREGLGLPNVLDTQNLSSDVDIALAMAAAVTNEFG